MKDLIKVANELQKVMDFEEGGPPVDGTEKELTKWVEEAVDEIDYETDKFLDEAVHILMEMDLWKGPALEKAEEEIVVGDVVEVDNLVDEIKAAGTMRDLKIICKDLDEFKSIRGQLTKYKTIKELREVMLGILEEGEKKEVKVKVKVGKKPEEKKEEPKVVVKKPAKTTRADVMSTILQESTKTPMTKKQMNERMLKLYGGSENEASFQVNIAVGYLQALGLITKNKDGTLKYNFCG